tara:strand:- start:2146 stop:3297 length:1152 start_codon:yes stop_codon:yes gene_type:complete
MKNYGLTLLIKFFWHTISPFNDKDFHYRVKNILLILCFIFFFGAIQIFNRCFLFLDNLLFPKFKNIKIDSPFFILGVPRSGTTFLHKNLSFDKKNFTTCSLQEMIFAPSIIQKLTFKTLLRFDIIIGSPIQKMIRFFENFIFKNINDAHESSLESPEEDFLLLLPYSACFLLIFLFPFKEIWNFAFFKKSIGVQSRKEILKLYRRMIQRHMYVYGNDKKYLSKNASFSSWIFDLEKNFPNMNVVYCIRRPSKAVPSIYSVMKRGWNTLNISMKRKKIDDKVSVMMEHYYESAAHYNRKMKRANFTVVRMYNIQNKLEQVIENLYHKTNINYDDDYKTFIKHESLKSKDYISKHTYKENQTDILSNLILLESHYKELKAFDNIK